jgi:opacity protein-like surface antigen
MGAFTVNASAKAYLSGNVAAIFVNDADFDEAGYNGEFSFDTGFGATIALGNALSNGMRFEAELGYGSSDLDEVSIDGFGSASMGGDITTLALMGNIYYDFCKDCTFSPFIGAGIGIENIDVDIDFAGSEDDTVFAYQIAAGGSFAVSSAVNLDVQYRFCGTDDPDLDGTEVEYTAHKVMVGIRYSF